jgi:nucleoid-associated protein Lsr2
MAQKVTVVLEDDLIGGPAEQTVRFAFDGTDYEIDLNAKNAAALHKQLAPYIEHARRAGRAPSRRPGRTTANRQRSGDIRAGPKSMAWRSVSAGASRSAWPSDTTRPADVSPGSNDQPVHRSMPGTGTPS